MATFAGSAGAPSFVPAGALNAAVRDVTFSSSYTTGGETIAPKDVGLASISFAHATIKAPAGSAVAVYYNPATGKLQAFTSAAEVANAVNLSALTVELAAFGKV